ncbi:MAG TPA: 2-oxo-4-hydroxy-4-carboxy-5-ureidoimidazoline decarboxylase [Ktedonobacterales bacterium]|jgi:OHCU decarboxylase|nr:2-oxo-4-hydroxy-4-carboxy-5-ureidoimidazoline decarboxylase [Ktedonobacterales bacterium]
MTISLDRLNALDQSDFVAALGGIFEGPPWIVTEAWAARPFGDVDALYAALCRVMYAAASERKVALIQAHPDLVGRAARTGTLGAASTAEQAAAGLNDLAADEIATFERLNAEYQQRFGFPFVICARENKKESILTGFAARMRNTREQEIATALDEIAKICRLRLLDTIQ